MTRYPSSRTTFTLAFVFALITLTFLRTNGWRFPSWNISQSISTQASSFGPEDAIYRMIDAQRKGDTKTYLDAFTGPTREQLLQVIQESSEPKFASYLMQNATFQGVAIRVLDRPSSEEAQLRVEYVFGDRNEVQDLYLKREGRSWKILKVASAEPMKSPFLFGSRVTD